MEPKSVLSGNRCNAMLGNNEPCKHPPEFQLFIPALSMKPLVLCSMHKAMCDTCFSSIGYFFKVFDYEVEWKQRELFRKAENRR